MDQRTSPGDYIEDFVFSNSLTLVQRRPDGLLDSLRRSPEPPLKIGEGIALFSGPILSWGTERSEFGNTETQ